MEENLYGRLVELLSFLVTGAQGLLEEPPIYGPLRLLEAAERLIEIIEAMGRRSEELSRLKEKLSNTVNLVLEDEEAFARAIDDLVEEIVAIIDSERIEE